MTLILGAIALLCGIPVGMIIGVVIGYTMFARDVNHSEPGANPEDWGV
jgi:ABC-type antimicrobial peptide transport system permease subunit